MKKTHKIPILTKRKQNKNNQDVKLISAKNAYESTKTPQMINAIAKINETRKTGRTSAYICDRDKPSEELIETLIAAGYDISIKVYKRNNTWSASNYRDEYFTIVYFDNKASGKINFEDSYSKSCFKNIGSEDNKDIYQREIE